MQVKTVLEVWLLSFPFVLEQMVPEEMEQIAACLIAVAVTIITVSVLREFGV